MPVTLVPRVHEDAGHHGLEEHREIAGLPRAGNRCVCGGVLRIDFTALHAMATVVTHGAAGGVLLRGDGFADPDKLHLPAFFLQREDAFPEHLFPAPQCDRLLELAVGHVGEAVFLAVYGHEALGTAVVGSHFVVRDGPLFVIERAEAEAVSSPAQGTTAQGTKQAMPWVVADGREVISIGIVAADAGNGT